MLLVLYSAKKKDQSLRFCLALYPHIEKKIAFVKVFQTSDHV